MAVKKTSKKKVAKKVVKDSVKDIKVTSSKTEVEPEVTTASTEEVKIATYEGKAVLDINTKVVNGKTYKEVRVVSGEVFVVGDEEFNNNYKED